VLYIYMDQAKDRVARLFGKRHVLGSEAMPITRDAVSGGHPVTNR
jgi:hypothetical protein